MNILKFAHWIIDICDWIQWLTPILPHVACQYVYLPFTIAHSFLAHLHPPREHHLSDDITLLLNWQMSK